MTDHGLAGELPGRERTRASGEGGPTERPTDGREHPEAHLHVEFYPVLRMPGRLKYLAGGEYGAGTFVSDGLPEEKAAELRRLL